jgi:hypothetical protein
MADVVKGNLTLAKVPPDEELKSIAKQVQDVTGGNTVILNIKNKEGTTFEQVTLDFTKDPDNPTIVKESLSL